MGTVDVKVEACRYRYDEDLLTTHEDKNGWYIILTYITLTNCPAANPAANRDDAMNSFMFFLNIFVEYFIVEWYSMVQLGLLWCYDDGGWPVIDD